MNADYLEPLRRSWQRARRMLFDPFRLEAWLVLGFAAFLAELGRGMGSGSWGFRLQPPEHADELAERLHDFLHRPLWAALLLVGLGVALVLGVVFTWISARGRFVFLDDVLHERVAIIEPWKRHARIGNSLFLFELLLGGAALALFLVLFALPLFGLLEAIWREGTLPHLFWRPLLIGFVLGSPLFLLLALCKVLTNQLVVPLMWKRGLGAFAAWGELWRLVTASAGAILLYLLFLLGLLILLVFAVLLFGCCTCCLGFVLLALPYIGSVVLLPALVTLRGLGPEFLAQFGPEWDVRPVRDPGPAPPAPESA